MEEVMSKKYKVKLQCWYDGEFEVGGVSFWTEDELKKFEQLREKYKDLTVNYFIGTYAAIGMDQSLENFFEEELEWEVTEIPDADYEILIKHMGKDYGVFTPSNLKSYLETQEEN